MSRICAIIGVFFMTSMAHAATLEIPGPASTQSGVGVISGWKCSANGRLTIRFDGGNAIPLLYGSERGDTRKPKGPCDDANTGFVAIMNWGILSDGTHTAVVYDNGVEFDRSTFTVVTTGVEFLPDVTGSGTATLSNGQRATLEWSEASQAFVAMEYTAPGGETASGVGQFLGTWRFTNSHTTQTYRFEACPGDDPQSCVYDYSQDLALVPGDVDGHSYALFHDDGAICRAYFLYEPTGNTVSGHYGYEFGSCDSDSIEPIVADVLLKKYPTTGRRISQ
ncbi:MAG: hypothetical protein OXC18_07660 [Desulfurellaceae bacterium]|nr:hypothetical protein [Desulfurellaceae bacterium]